MEKLEDADLKNKAEIKFRKTQIRHRMDFGHFIKATLWSIYNFAPWHSYLFIAISFVVICTIGKYLIKLFCIVCGDLGIILKEISKVLRKIINPIAETIGKVARSFKRGKRTSKKPVHSEIYWRMDIFRAMSVLNTNDGCKDIKNWWHDVVYWIQRSIGRNGLCRDLKWYHSISLTRYLVYYPVKWLFWTSMHGDCHVTLASDLCAVAGLAYVFEFLLKKGIILIVVVTRCWPLITLFLKFIQLELNLLVYEVKYQIHKLNPRMIAHKHVNLNYKDRRKIYKQSTTRKNKNSNTET